MSVTEAIQKIASDLLAISVPVSLKKQIADPIEIAVINLKGLYDTVGALIKKDEEEKENLRKINQEMAEKLMGKAAPAEEHSEQGKDQG